MKFIKITTVLIFMTSLWGCGEQARDFFDQTDPNRIPGISFETPRAGQTITDAAFEITTAFTNVQLLDTWNLYYISDSTPNKSEAIAVNVPVTSRTIDWATVNRPAGEYYFYAELNANNSVITSTSTGSILVVHNNGDSNGSPSVNLTTPNGGESFAIGSTVSIAWSSSDPNGESLTSDIEYSTNGGNSWTSLTSGESGSRYDWVIDSSFQPGINYKLRVTVTDGSASQSSDVSNSSFILF